MLHLNITVSHCKILIALSEAQTHNLQNMRLTCCLLRYEGILMSHINEVMREVINDFMEQKIKMLKIYFKNYFCMW